MYSRKITETLVGLFMLAGMLALLALALKVSGLTTYFGHQGYNVTAGFDNIGGLKIRAPVTLAGVRIGEVTDISLDETSFKAIVTLRIDPSQDKLPSDTSASILTQGLLGANYISLSPGYANTYLKNNDQIVDTHPALILENLIGQFLFNAKSSK